jgi:hypothetical protein
MSVITALGLTSQGCLLGLALAYMAYGLSHTVMVWVEHKSHPVCVIAHKACFGLAIFATFLVAILYLVEYLISRT